MGVETRLLDGPLGPPPDWQGDDATGSELIFHGRVRGSERGRPIRGLFYEHYDGMAQSELEALARETAARFGLLALCCHHRVGEVPVGETSVRVILRTAHRAEGIAALSHFVRELKRRVPIWKWGVSPDGERFPSNHCEGCEAEESGLHHHPPPAAGGTDPASSGEPPPTPSRETDR